MEQPPLFVAVLEEGRAYTSLGEKQLEPPPYGTLWCQSRETEGTSQF